MSLHPFGSYELLHRFGIGGTSELWLALPKERRGNNRPLLLKRILPHLAEEPAAVERFLQEAKSGAYLQHPNIVRLFASGEVQGLHYIAREFFHGKDLNSVQLLARSRPSVLTPERALHIIASVCEALAYAYHSRQQLHGGLAARHILIDTHGTVKVLDFGGTRSASRAPEHLLGKALDHRTDLFTAGLLLYELLTGVRPFERNAERDTARATLECRIPPPSHVAQVPPALDAVVMKALAKAPEDRYQDARDFQRALEAYLTAQWAAPGPESLTAMMYRLSTEPPRAKNSPAYAAPPRVSPEASSAPREGTPTTIPARPPWSGPVTQTCEIVGVAMDSSLIGVTTHKFGSPLPASQLLPYSLEVSVEAVLARFNDYYQDFIDTESADDGIQEEPRGDFLRLKETGYLSLEKMFTEQPALLASLLLHELPGEFMGYLFFEEGAIEEKQYILHTLTEVRITDGMVVCKGQAFRNPLWTKR